MNRKLTAPQASSPTPRFNVATPSVESIFSFDRRARALGFKKLIKHAKVAMDGRLR
jgi:hypothetical protein